MPCHRRHILDLAAAALVFATAAAGVGAQPLTVRLEQGQIHISSAQTQFLQGKLMSRLRGGAPVVFAVQVSLIASPRGGVLARAAGRFAVSFDIWEERFAVTRLAHTRKPASRMTAAEAENWCLEELTLPESAVSPDAPFWVRLDVRAEESEDKPAPGEDAAITLARLVELFGRTDGNRNTRLNVEAGPWRLRDLHKGG